MAAQRIEQERAAGVRRVIAQVRGLGLAHCEDCADEIETARRGAMPSARKCLSCQEAAERRRQAFSGARA